MHLAAVFLVFTGCLRAQGTAAAHYGRGVELLRSQNPAEAIEEFDQALKLDPRMAEASHAKGLALLAEGNPASALEEFHRAIKIKPGLAEAHLGFGLALGQTGELEAAAGEFRTAIQLRPAYAEAHKRLGVTLRRLGDENQALAEFELAVKWDPSDPEAFYNLGLARKARGETAAAVLAFQRAIALKPDFEKAHYNLGIALRAAGDQDAAQKELAEIRGLHEFRGNLTESKAMILRGVDALKEGHNREACSLFEQAAAKSPSLATAWHYLGAARDSLGDRAGALSAWAKALEIQPDYPKTHTALGLIYAREADFVNAEAEFRKSASADPDDAESHYNLGLALARLGRLDRAIPEFTEAVTLNPRYRDARMQLGLAYSAKGDTASAVNAYRELIRLEPAMAEAHNNLGVVLLQQNDVAAARREFRRALALDPAFAPAQQNVQRTEPCQVVRPTATLVVPHVGGAPELNADPRSEVWRRSASAMMSKDCTREIDYPELATEVKMFWTAEDLYLLFVCPYGKLNLWLPPHNESARDKLWDRDVVEFFLGSDWNEIRRYREFEVAPTGDWIDLAIDLSRKSYDKNWRSGWKTTARIDPEAHTWYAAARVPLKSVSPEPVKAGTRWRMNLYRIEGEGPDSRRRFLCWQPTCVVNRDPNHVPENFGTLVFAP